MNPYLLNVGATPGNPGEPTILEKISRQLLRKPQAQAKNFLIIELEDDHFFHGGFSIEASLGTFIFFQDSDLGMLNLMSALNHKNILLSRFSITSGLQVAPPQEPAGLN